MSAASLGALRSAHAAAVALGAQRLVEEVETLATWYRADLLPAQVEVTQGDPLAAYALTEREREVLAALAAGHTNREIAEAMFISVKTASVHVSNILRKLDVSGPPGGGPDRAPARRRGRGGRAPARGDHPRNLRCSSDTCGRCPLALDRSPDRLGHLAHAVDRELDHQPGGGGEGGVDPVHDGEGLELAWS